MKTIALALSLAALTISNVGCAWLKSLNSTVAFQSLAKVGEVPANAQPTVVPDGKGGAYAFPAISPLKSTDLKITRTHPDGTVDRVEWKADMAPAIRDMIGGIRGVDSDKFSHDLELFDRGRQSVLDAMSFATQFYQLRRDDLASRPPSESGQLRRQILSDVRNLLNQRLENVTVE